MKVIICFGSVKVVVPCGDGDLLVKELIDKAVLRYIKTLDKPSGIQVNVFSLRTSENDAILDHGDRLKDVVDDKDQLVAEFTVTPENLYTQRGGDGTSGSSGGTPSPEFSPAFKDFKKGLPHEFDPSTETIITAQDIITQSHNLVIRRCSDDYSSSTTHDSNIRVPGFKVPTGKHEKAPSLPVHMSTNGSFHDPKLKKLRPPSCNLNHCDHHYSHSHGSTNFLHNNFHHSNNTKDFMHNLPDGLNQKISHYDSNVAKINNVNFKNLNHMNYKVPPSSNHKTTNLTLSTNDGNDDETLNNNFLSLNQKHHFTDSISNRYFENIFPPHDHPISSSSSNNNDGVLCSNTQSSSVLDKIVSTKDMLGFSTSNSTFKKEKFFIDLVKGPRGLGFSVTTQDNKTSEKDSHIFVKKILPCGSAVEDGRLEPGDCILEVNGVPMTGKPQEEVVALLRTTPVGGKVKMLVTRTTKSLYFPSNTIEATKLESEDVTLGKNYSEGSSLYNLGMRAAEHCDRNSQPDTASVLSLEDDSRRLKSSGFVREGLGRQSMSEKRKGHLDPRTTETFNKIQTHRSDKNRNLHNSRAESVESLISHSSSSGLKFSASCDGILGSFRARNINDSFRAAIDKCLDDCDSKGQTELEKVSPKAVSRNTNNSMPKEKQKSGLKGFTNVLKFGKQKKSEAENNKKPAKYPTTSNKVLKASENNGDVILKSRWK